MAIQVPASQIPRVYLHDGNGRRLGQLTTAESINRSYSLDKLDRAIVRIALSDPLVEVCDPLSGRILVIESAHYPLPWAGKVIEWSGDHERVELVCRSYDGILRQRFLPSGYRTNSTAGEEMRRIVETVNVRNPTGITIGDIENHILVTGVALPDWEAWRALDAIASLAGMEWWLDHETSPSGIVSRFRVARARGFDRFREVTLTTGPGGNAEWPRWRGDAEAAAFLATVIAGQEDLTQSFTERSRSVQIVEEGGGFVPGFAGTEAETIITTFHRADGTIGTVWRYIPATPATPDHFTPITRREQVSIEEQLRTRDITVQAARMQLAQRRYSEQVIDLNVIAASAWPDVQPGNVVRLIAHGAFVRGWDGPVRILGVQPMEELGVLRATVELLHEVDAVEREPVEPAEPDEEEED